MLKTLLFNIIIFILCILSPSLHAESNLLVHNTDYLKSYSEFMQGELLYNNKKYESAIHFYKRAIRLYPEYPEPYYKLIKIYYYNKDLYPINGFIKKCLGLKNLFKNKNDLYDLYKIMSEYYEDMKDYQNAIKNYNIILTVNSNQPFCFYKLGYNYYKFKKNDEAYDYLDKFVNFVRQNKKGYTSKDEFKESLKILININMDRNNYIEAYDLLAELNAYWPDKAIRQKMMMLSNNLKYYK